MANDMLTGLISSFAEPALEDLGARLGIPASTVKAAAPVVVGLVLTAIQRMAAQPGGSDMLTSLLQSSSDRLGDRDLDTFVKEADPSNSAALLHALSGSNSIQNVASNLAHSFDMQPESAGQLLGLMAPAVMSQIAGMASDEGLDAQGIFNAVETDTAALEAMGNLGHMLDNEPGITDDIKRAFHSLFG